MPIRPRPFTYRCDECGWSATVAPVSDALGPNDIHHRCGNCGNPALQRGTPSRLQALIATLKRDLGGRPPGM
ncbi:hypothetical protein [Alcanivorax quisquiliarum]|uniref:Regulatory protein FmdB Zinc ribbon domain-containing protein n=1 Tax=Alcanivorax quisquiliarum TaxID=2933565 RepID=A0ABT0E9Z3_9GAMM|nr:hypothetical protein [Alcanivorax quisquiliarum]MCK0538663.1 hypothetical protein [Alcanivorax quisquiliarum]